MRVEDTVLDVLRLADIAGREVRMQPMAPALYRRVDSVLKAAGGRWSRKAQAHLFDDAADETIAQILRTGQVEDARRARGAFFTPPELAERVIARANILPGMRVLEPSAGHGALALPALRDGAIVDCVEIDLPSVILLGSMVDAAGRAFRRITHGDFRRHEPAELYDVVVMNPPFADQASIHHIEHAIACLKPGGRLVAIASSGVTFHDDALSRRFRATIAASGTIAPLPAHAFLAAGTNVSTVLVTYDKPEVA